MQTETLVSGTSLVIKLCYARTLSVVLDDHATDVKVLATYDDVAEYDSLRFATEGSNACLRQSAMHRAQVQSSGSSINIGGNVMVQGNFTGGSIHQDNYSVYQNMGKAFGSLFSGGGSSSRIVGGQVSSGPTLDLIVTVPAKASLHVDLSGAVVASVSHPVQGTLVLDLSGSCEIHVPGAIDGTFDLSGSSSAAVGPITGPFTCDVSGSSSAAIGPITGPFTCDLSGSSSVSVASVTGPIACDLSESASLSMQSCTAPTATLETSGNASVRVSDGQIGRVSAEADGASKIRVGARVGTGSATASGAARIRMDTVTGNVQRATSGAASIKIG